MSDIMMKALQLQAESLTRQVKALAAESKLLTAENAGVRQLLTDFAERHAADETRLKAMEAENARLRDDWKKDPAGDERWNAGVDFAMSRLCEMLLVDPHGISWDAATETLEGDVMSVIGNILTAAFGDDWPDRLARAAELEIEEATRNQHNVIYGPAGKAPSERRE